MKKVTLKDIAKELNITVAAVSHALNGMSDISEETKAKVFETAKRLGYISNSAAVSLRSGKTNTIAIIVPDISNPHFAYQIKLIEDKMKEHNYSVIILNTNENEDVEYKAITTALSKQVDGILLCPCQQTKDNIEFLNRVEIPFALIGRYYSELDTDFICADDFKGGYLAGKFLIEKGCKNPVYVGAYKYIEPSINRFCGLKKAFEEVHMNIPDGRFIQISPKLDSTKNIVEDMYRKKCEFDCIVAFSDIIAFEVTSYVRKIYGISVPVVGFDAINSHLFMPFYNVSVGMVGDGWADKSTKILLDKIKGSTERFRETINVELFEYNS